MRNSMVEEYLRNMSATIDTLSADNPLLREGGIDNLEEAKKEFRLQLDTARMKYDELKLSGSNSFLEFKKDGRVVLTNLDGESTSNWEMEENDIIVDDAEQTGTYMINRFNILKLTKDSLKLRMIVKSDTTFTSYVKTK